MVTSQGALAGMPLRKITLNGSGYDLEDGLLSGSALIWASDRDGSLGSGDTLTTTLTVGQHTITLQATDSDALTATAAIIVEILADFDGDGLSDTYEASQGILDWWNSADAGADSDGDGLTNRSEAAWGTDPADADTDGDGVPDNEEITGGSSPLDPGSQPQAPELLASAVELNFAALVDSANPESEEILLISSTPAVLTWTVSVDVPWLSTQAISGTTPSIVAVDVDMSALSAANYKGHITFQTGDNELTIPVYLAVVDHTSQPHSVFLPLVIKGLP